MNNNRRCSSKGTLLRNTYKACYLSQIHRSTAKQIDRTLPFKCSIRDRVTCMHLRGRAGHWAASPARHLHTGAELTHASVDHGAQCFEPPAASPATAATPSSVYRGRHGAESDSKPRAASRRPRHRHHAYMISGRGTPDPHAPDRRRRVPVSVA